MFEHISDAYCLRLLEYKRSGDHDNATLAEVEDRPVLTIDRCINRALEIELRKKQRGAL